MTDNQSIVTTLTIDFQPDTGRQKAIMLVIIPANDDPKNSFYQRGKQLQAFYKDFAASHNILFISAKIDTKSREIFDTQDPNDIENVLCQQITTLNIRHLPVMGISIDPAGNLYAVQNSDFFLYQKIRSCPLPCVP